MSDLLLKMLKQAGIVEKKHVALKNAGDSDVYLDIKKAYGNPDLLGYLSVNLWHIINKDNPTCLAASGYGGIPLASAMALTYHWKLSLVRDGVKPHGNIKMIDGYLPDNNDRVAIIDDVVTTGGSLATMMHAINQTGAVIVGCYAVARRKDIELSSPLHTLYTLEDFL